MSNEPQTHIGLAEGPELLGCLFAIALWGITCVQSIFYFMNFPLDKFVLKVMVSWLWMTDTTHQLLIAKEVYGQLITNFCNYSMVHRVSIEFLWQGLLTTLVALPSQFFFIDRIAKFSGKRWLPFAFWVPTAVLQLAGSSAFVAFGWNAPSTQDLVTLAPSVAFTTVQATAAVVDFSITATLIFLLWRSRGDAQYKMRPVIQRLMILSLITGVWAALLAIFTVITMLAFPNTLIYGGIYFPLCPVYCNTVLANLNARQVMEKIRRRCHAADANAAEHGSIPLWRETGSYGDDGGPPTTTAISISGVSQSQSQTQTHGLEYVYELSRTPSPRSQCRSVNERRHVETGVQTSSDTFDGAVQGARPDRSNPEDGNHGI